MRRIAAHLAGAHFLPRVPGLWNSRIGTFYGETKPDRTSPRGSLFRLKKDPSTRTATLAYLTLLNQKSSASRLRTRFEKKPHSQARQVRWKFNRCLTII